MIVRKKINEERGIATYKGPLYASRRHRFRTMVGILVKKSERGLKKYPLRKKKRYGISPAKRMGLQKKRSPIWSRLKKKSL